MSIKSTAFGGVVLTGDDAAKFARQVRYGRPSKAAIETVKQGSMAVKSLRENGKITITLKERKLATAR